MSKVSGKRGNNAAPARGVRQMSKKREMVGTMDSFRGTDYAASQAAGLDAIQTAGEMTYCEQEEDGADCLRGSWFIADDDTRTLILGTFGNDNSPGAFHYTYAERYSDESDYRAALAEWEAKEEYLESADESEEDSDGE
jgi:hypothetical protein